MDRKNQNEGQNASEDKGEQSQIQVNQGNNVIPTNQQGENVKSEVINPQGLPEQGQILDEINQQNSPQSSQNFENSNQSNENQERIHYRINMGPPMNRRLKKQKLINFDVNYHMNRKLIPIQTRIQIKHLKVQMLKAIYESIKEQKQSRIKMEKARQQQEQQKFEQSKQQQCQQHKDKLQTHNYRSDRSEDDSTKKIPKEQQQNDPQQQEESNKLKKETIPITSLLHR